MKFKPAWMVLIAGGVFGLLFALLIKLGNPGNMGVCVACFTRDIAGALKLHNPRRPELTTVEEEIVGTYASRKRRLIQERFIERLDLKKQSAFVLIPVHVDEAIELIEGRGLLRYRWFRTGTGAQ